MSNIFDTRAVGEPNTCTFPLPPTGTRNVIQTLDKDNNDEACIFFHIFLVANLSAVSIFPPKHFINGIQIDLTKNQV